MKWFSKIIPWIEWRTILIFKATNNWLCLKMSKVIKNWKQTLWRVFQIMNYRYFFMCVVTDSSCDFLVLASFIHSTNVWLILISKHIVHSYSLATIVNKYYSFCLCREEQATQLLMECQVLAGLQNPLKWQSQDSDNILAWLPRGQSDPIYHFLYLFFYMYTVTSMTWRAF